MQKFCFFPKNACISRKSVLKYILTQDFIFYFKVSEEVFGLPNIKSAKKRVLKTKLKYFDAAVSEGNRVEADQRYLEAVKAVDQAAARGLMHKNTAANRKSKLTLRLNKLPQ